jgi:hypothetical protein
MTDGNLYEFVISLLSGIYLQMDFVKSRSRGNGAPAKTRGKGGEDYGDYCKI